MRRERPKKQPNSPTRTKSAPQSPRKSPDSGKTGLRPGSGTQDRSNRSKFLRKSSDRSSRTRCIIAESIKIRRKTHRRRPRRTVGVILAGLMSDLCRNGGRIRRGAGRNLRGVRRRLGKSSGSSTREWGGRSLGLGSKRGVGMGRRRGGRRRIGVGRVGKSRFRGRRGGMWGIGCIIRGWRGRSSRGGMLGSNA